MGDTFNKRSTSFGVGDRFKVPRNQLMTPPPGTYNTINTFDGANPTINKNHLTTNFRQQSAREDYGKVYVPGSRRSPKGFEDMPGPGTYDFNNKKIGYDCLKTTLKERAKDFHDPFQKGAKLLNPGPGAYKAIGIDSEGKYSVSNIPNSKASAWSPKKSARFKQEMYSYFKNPPPGTYCPSDQDSMSGYGTYILSNFKTLGTKKIQQMSNAKSPSTAGHEGLFAKQSTTPGPGAYLLPSEFGTVAGGKQYYQTSVTDENSTFGESAMGRTISRINQSEMRTRSPQRFYTTDMETDLQFMKDRHAQNSVPQQQLTAQKRRTSVDSRMAQAQKEMNMTSEKKQRAGMMTADPL